MRRKISCLSSDQIYRKFAGRKVFVYFNLHKKLWSVKCTVTGLVLCHASSLQIVHAKAKVSEAGRKRVLSQGRKNVHAGITGIIPELRVAVGSSDRISYNPHKSGNFFYSDIQDNPNWYGSTIVSFDGDRKVYSAEPPLVRV